MGVLDFFVESGRTELVTPQGGFEAHSETMLTFFKLFVAVEKKKQRNIQNCTFGYQ